jgi:hypothetical protein
MDKKQNGFKSLVIIGVLLSTFVSAYFYSYTWTEVELCSENLIYGNLNTDRLNMDGFSKSIASSSSQSVIRGLGLNFFLPFFLFQIPPYKKAIGLRC